MASDPPKGWRMNEVVGIGLANTRSPEDVAKDHAEHIQAVRAVPDFVKDLLTTQELLRNKFRSERIAKNPPEDKIPHRHNLPRWYDVGPVEVKPMAIIGSPHTGEVARIYDVMELCIEPPNLAGFSVYSFTFKDDRRVEMRTQYARWILETWWSIGKAPS